MCKNDSHSFSDLGKILCDVDLLYYWPISDL